jgi:hypothetical protein
MTDSKDGKFDEILRDLRHESESIMYELSEMEEMLLEMKKGVEKGTLSDSELLNSIDELRKKIGLVEHLDQEEYKIEESAAALVYKLKELIDKNI